MQGCEEFVDDPALIYTKKYLESCPKWLKTANRKISSEFQLGNQIYPFEEMLEIDLPWKNEPIQILHLDPVVSVTIYIDVYELRCARILYYCTQYGIQYCTRP